MRDKNKARKASQSKRVCVIRQCTPEGHEYYAQKTEKSRPLPSTGTLVRAISFYRYSPVHEFTTNLSFCFTVTAAVQTFRRVDADGYVLRM